MSWRYGPFVVEQDYVADIDTVNDNFRAIVGEVTAQLNEHNFARNSFSDRSLWAEDIGLKLNHVKVNYAAACASETVQPAFDWRPLGVNFNKSFVTKCRKVWVCASFQAGFALEYGVFLALELDGIVLGESLLGSGDHGNDLIDKLDVSLFPTISYSFGATPGIFMPLGSTPVAQQRGGPFVLDAVIDIPPGEHIIRPVFFSLKQAGFSEIGNLGDYELIVMEMW